MHVEIELVEGTDPPLARIRIGETESCLLYAEVCALAANARILRSEMEWVMATHAYAHTGSSETRYHLVEIRDGCERSPSFCGRPAPVSEDGWDLSPVIGNPSPSTCRTCMSVYERRKRFPARHRALGLEGVHA